ncbi:hypothetical protein OIU84_001102 [Salix udensis]|uniref:Citrate transporter-like domain-containing protein n=1 Tax=Salix udensis TaxID=889485 RepID=A0AAD6K857_9ROSI|nr:hypothetical protein OIU84_001102 [Salix udensis]
MALAPLVKLVLGTFAFAIFWVLAVFPAVPFLPIGRTAGSLLGAILMVIFQLISPAQAYASIDLSILGLLFGTIVVSVYLERADAFIYLSKLLSWKSLGAEDLVCRVCLLSAISSAFFTNDTSCMMLTEFVLQVAKQHNLPPQPFLLALASSSNIGSSASPIGNPQNLVVAVNGQIPFLTFFVGIAPAAVVGVFVNAVIIICMYWRELSSHHKEEDDANAETVADDDTSFYRLSPATSPHFPRSSFQERSILLDMEGSPSSHGNSAYFNTLRYRSDAGETDMLRVPSIMLESAGNSSACKKWKSILWKSCVYLVTLGMLIAMVMGINMSWAAVTAAVALMVLDFKDAQPCLEKVSYSLLILFCGMFMTIEGFNKTGIPGCLWEFVEPFAQINRASGIAVLAVLILVLTNMVSNVPTVLLLGARMAASAACISPDYVKKSWLTLAWVSTVAGNLSLLGSAANMVVCEQASRAPNLGYNLSFWSHLKFGVPSTIIVTAIGLTIIR